MQAGGLDYGERDGSLRTFILSSSVEETIASEEPNSTAFTAVARAGLPIR
jgi:hypothetical protein